MKKAYLFFVILGASLLSHGARADDVKCFLIKLPVEDQLLTFRRCFYFTATSAITIHIQKIVDTNLLTNRDHEGPILLDQTDVNNACRWLKFKSEGHQLVKGQSYDQHMAWFRYLSPRELISTYKTSPIWFLDGPRYDDYSMVYPIDLGCSN